VTLGILYHMPFWRAEDGSLWESEGSFARYVDSLAPYFDRVLLSVPVFDRPQAAGSRVRARNVSLAPLPYFPGPRQFYPMLPRVTRRLREWVDQCDIINLRVPTPAGIVAFRHARKQRKPVFLLVVGDYAGLLPHLPYRGWKRAVFSAYVAVEERSLRHMVRRALTFVNGAALRVKHEAQGATVVETKTTTLSSDEIVSRDDTCDGAVVRLLTVSRIDPRKGLRVLPDVVARLGTRGLTVQLDIVGAPIGLIGEAEQDAISHEARTQGVADRVRLVGPVPLDRLMPMYREYDIFVLPTRPGEGIPRVLLEAMASGLPVVTTDVSGIGSLITNGRNGLLVGDSAEEIAAAVATLVTDRPLRRSLIAGGYDTARAHTLERQAATMMAVVGDTFHVRLRREPQVA
jgi:glycosyltransferase involved in cell wall biosynthesis